MKKRVIEFILLTVLAVIFLSGCKKNVGTPEDNPVVEEDEESAEPETFSSVSVTVIASFSFI